MNESKAWRSRIHPLWLIVVPTVLAVLVTFVLMRWQLPVLVHVELTTQRVEFVADADEINIKSILNGLELRSVGVEKFRSVEFAPDSIEVANPLSYNLEKDVFPPSAWKRLQVTQPEISFVPEELAQPPRVTVEEVGGPGKTGLRLDPIGVSPGMRVSIETRVGRSAGLAIATTGQSRAYLSLGGPFTLIAENARVTGAAPIYDKNAELTYEVRLRDSAPSIQIVAQPDGLVILPVIRNGPKTADLASEIAVSTLDFTRQDSMGERVSALIGKGLITFPQYPKLGSITISDSDAVGLEKLEKFSITKLTLAPGAHAMSLVADGMAGQIRTKTGEIPFERHLTAFDALSQNSKLMALAAILGWIIPTMIGVQRFFKDLKH